MAQGCLPRSVRGGPGMLTEVSKRWPRDAMLTEVSKRWPRDAYRGQ